MQSDRELRSFLLHVVETIEHIAFDEMKDFYERLHPSARTGLKDFSNRFVEAGLDVDQAVVYGHRTKEVVSFAITHRNGLIFMASHRIDPDRPAPDWGQHQLRGWHSGAVRSSAGEVK